MSKASGALDQVLSFLRGEGFYFAEDALLREIEDRGVKTDPAPADSSPTQESHDSRTSSSEEVSEARRAISPPDNLFGKSPEAEASPSRCTPGYAFLLRLLSPVEPEMRLMERQAACIAQQPLLMCSDLLQATLEASWTTPQPSAVLEPTCRAGLGLPAGPESWCVLAGWS